MTRLSSYIQIALLAAVVTLLIRVWPLTMQQPTAGQSSAESLANSFGKIQLPRDTEIVLADIEKTLSDESRRPQTREEIEKLQERLKVVVNALSPNEQEQILPRLVPRRWEIQALWLLASENQPPGSDIGAIRELADEIDLLHANSPADIADTLSQQLAQREKALRKSIAKLERASALKQGKEALAAKDTNAIDSAIRGLVGFEDDECKALAYQLGLRRELEATEADLSTLEKLETRNLRAYGLAKLNQGLTDLKLRVALNAKKFGNSDKNAEQLAGLDRRVSNLLDTELKLARAEAQRKSRDYQTWALAQLKAVPTFDALLDVELVKVASMVDRKNPLSKAHQDAEERAMNELDRIMNVRIAPINQALLDEAVATWYRKVFQDRFDKLSDAHRLKVVTAFATTDKRSIEQ